MAKCKLCGREKNISESCNKHFIRIDSVYYQAVKYYAKNKTLYEIHNNIAKRCPGCGVKEGGYHHVGCIFEICPKCAKFWLSCSCFGIKVNKKQKNGEVIPLYSRQ